MYKFTSEYRRIANRQGNQVAKGATWNFHFLRFLFSLLFLTRSNANSAYSYSICTHLRRVEHIYRWMRVDISRIHTNTQIQKKTNRMCMILYNVKKLRSVKLTIQWLVCIQLLHLPTDINLGRLINSILHTSQAGTFLVISRPVIRSPHCPALVLICLSQLLGDILVTGSSTVWVSTLQRFLRIFKHLQTTSPLHRVSTTSVSFCCSPLSSCERPWCASINFQTDKNYHVTIILQSHGYEWSWMYVWV